MRLIDAEHLKGWIMLRWESGVSVGYDDVKTNEILEQIDRELTINLEPRKKGKWIDTGSGQECSECHEIQYGYDSFRHFCAFCGSYNGGEQE